MKIKWKKSLYFSKTERNGIAILAGLCSIAFLLPMILPSLLPKEKTDFSDFEQEVAAFDLSLKRDKEESLSRQGKSSTSTLFDFNPNIASKEVFIQLGLSPSVANTIINYRNAGAQFYRKEDFKKIYGLKATEYQRLAPYIKLPKPKTTFVKKRKPIPPTTKERPKKKDLSPFPFNPNTADKAVLLQLGLSPKVAQTLLNFRSKGGQFYKKEDLKKIYGLSEKDYLTLAPFIEIPTIKPTIITKSNIPKDRPSAFSSTTAIKIDINQAGVEEWTKLPGIGMGYAKRIVNFRNKLGGFHNLEQIGTTYGVPDSVLQKIRTQLLLSPISTKIPINSISAEALKSHPYIKTKQAYIIINYRMNHGQFRSIEGIKKIRALSPAFIKRIAPYLSYE